MSQFRFELATADDDADLRRILAATPMPGHVTVSYRREPSYFDGAVISGDFHQVLVARDAAASRIAGFVSRSVRPMNVNGEPEPIGYLGGLRFLPKDRKRGLLARGIVLLRQLHADGRAKLYLLSIADGNDEAIKVLTSGRTGLPKMHFAGRYFGLAIPIPTRRRRIRASRSDLVLEEARREDLPEIVEFLRTSGPKRQFFPCYEQRDFFHPHATFKDLQPEDLILARRGGRLVGTLGAWDQHGFKQSIVEGYTAGLRLVSPVYNFWARLRGMPAIPRPGTELRYLTAALPVVADDDPEVFTSLVDDLLARASGGDCQYLMLGLHQQDPLFGAARQWGGRTYVGRLYVACWEDGEARRAQLDGRAPYMELGSM
jgi:hypothetical protein